MRIVPLLAIIGVIVLVVALGAKTIITGNVIENSVDSSDNSIQNNDSSSENLDNPEPEVIVELNDTNITAVQVSSGGGGGTSNGENDGEEDPIPEEVCDFVDNDNDGEIDEGCANIYGTIYDTDTGLPIEGANISFYDKSVYDVYDDSGNYSLLVPKEIPDSVTDVNGSYNVSILEGDYHMVIQSSDEKDFNIKAKKSQPLEHNIEMDEDRGDVNFNAEGHILYSGEYEYNDENLYTCGDILKFMMFGVNKGTTNETITFLIQDHSTVGGPNAPIIYNGSINNSNESFTVLAGEKVHKVFDFEIPCSFDIGKYDIHILWNDEKWHKIGNFFIINDSTSPGINLWGEREGYVGEPIEVGYATFNYPQEGTIRSLNLGVIEGSNNMLTVIIDKDINTDSDNDTIKNNDYDYTISAGNNEENDLIYNSSGNYTARFTVIDSANNSYSKDINIEVYITEEEANETAFEIYNLFGLVTLLQYNVDELKQGVNPIWDRFTIERGGIGDEYIGKSDNVSQNDIDYLENRNCDAPYVRAFGPSSLEEYNQTLYDHLMFVKCDCGESIGGPSCP